MRGNAGMEGDRWQAVGAELRHATWRLVRNVCAVNVMMLVVMFVLVSQARAVEFGKQGTGAGELGEIGGLAVSEADGELYVLDRIINHRVDVFTAEGTFLKAWGWGVADGKEEPETCTSVCLEGLSGTGAGEFGSEARGIAVDNAFDGSFGDVYAVDERNSRVEKFGPGGEFLLAFGREVNLSKITVRKEEEARKELVTVTRQEEDVCTGAPGDECGAGSPGEGEAAFEFAGRGEPIAVGSTGVVYVGSRGRVEEFGEEGEFLRSVGVHNANGEQLAGIEAVAVGGFGNIFVIAEGEPKVLEYEEASAGVLTLLHALAASEPEALAYDEQDSVLLVEDGGRTPERHFFEYDAGGPQTEAFPGNVAAHGESDGIAWDEKTGELYFASIFNSPGVIKSLPLPPPGPLVTEHAVQPHPRGSVTFTAKVDPEGSGTEVWFEYEASPGVWASTTAQRIAGEVSKEPNFNEETVDEHGKPLEATVEGLAAGKTYNYRAHAINGNGVAEPAGTFATLPAASIDSESVRDVTAEGATLEAEINPLDSATSYWFEYRPQGSSSYTSTAVGHLAAGEADIAVSAHVSGLAPHTTYGFRLVAENAFAEGAAAVHGEERAFVTQSVGAPMRLPDGRGWEMVSPVNKQGASFESIPFNGGLIEGAAEGDGITYLATAASEPSPPGEPSPEWVQILSRHGATGWSSRDIASPHEQEWGTLEGHFAEFLAFSPNLSVELVEPQGDTLLGGATERTPYLRRQVLCEQGTTANGCYLPLLNSEDVTSGEKWGGPPGQLRGAVHYVGSTSDLSHLVLQSEVPLTTGASGPGTYEWSAGKLALVSLLPGAPAHPASCPAVSEPRRRHMISSDGDRVIWEDRCEGEHLYMREAAGDRTVQLDVVQGGSGSSEVRPEFQDASSDGSRVFFSDRQQLTADSHAGSGMPDVYVYEADSDSSLQPGLVRDITVPVHAGERANVLGTIPGVSTDGSVAYVVAGGVLSEAANERGESAQPGQPNLYRIQRIDEAGHVNWKATFIATLSAKDEPDWTTKLSGLTSGLSENGQWLAFMSDRSLTGYDNRDAMSGQRDEEVFLYDAFSRRLVCASCDPSGARPRGIERVGEGLGPLIDGQHIWRGQWLAALIPGWDTMELGAGVYRSRYLSDSGRLFFDSVDGLVSQDVNGTSDVYEYEPTGVGNCSSGAETFTGSTSGCVALISSGTSTTESVFLDASESGDDVFFLTAAKLAPQDADDAYDAYDAHVCGSRWECPPPVRNPSSPCESEATCRAPTPSFTAGELSPDLSIKSGGSNGRKAGHRKLRRGGRARCGARDRRIKNARRRKKALARCRRSRRSRRQALRSGR